MDAVLTTYLPEVHSIVRVGVRINRQLSTTIISELREEEATYALTNRSLYKGSSIRALPMIE